MRALLERHGIQARKGLGQHFLCSAAAVDSITSCLSGINGVLEIGPGPGVLTAPISEKVQRVIALEVDPRMIEVLRESAPRADLRQQDALGVDLIAILNELPTPRAVVSNLPYYITGPLVTKIAEARASYAKAVLMMQREVAQRFTAKAGASERGSISVYLQAIFTIEEVCEVPPDAFIPPPKVDSTVLELVPAKAEFDDEFFAMVRQGFEQPRKTLANNLAGFANFSREQLQDLFVVEGLSRSVRPHQLTLEQWLRLYRGLKANLL